MILEPKKIKSITVSTVSPSICYEVMESDAMIVVFSECWVLSQLFHFSSFTFIKRVFSSSSFYAMRMVSPAYLRSLIFLLAVLIPACVPSSPAFLMMYSVYKLNKQDNNIAFTYSFPNFEAVHYSLSVTFWILSVTVWEKSVFSLVIYNLSVPISVSPIGSPILSGPFEKDALAPDVQNQVLGTVQTCLL